MRRQAILLGFYSLCAQVLLLRELVSSLNGDELFIGTALFGWLLSAATGAFIGGKKPALHPERLFVVGIILLPVLIIAVRLSPLAVTETVGETIPFFKAALLSIIAMIPLGLLSGMLFPSIARLCDISVEAVSRVYLFEGLGAFVGGLAITVGTGQMVSTLAAAIIVSILVVSLLFMPPIKRRYLPGIVLAIAVLVGAVLLTPLIDLQIDSIKYHPYQVRRSFDTPYGHQAILEREGSFVLVTDNTVEAVYPDRETTENQFLPPLLYYPEARRVLFIGRAEFGLSQMADSFPGLSVTAVDSRREISVMLDGLLPAAKNLVRIDNDPVRFLSRAASLTKYDLIILNPGEPDNYHNSRFFTESFLNAVRQHLRADGLLFIPMSYDSDCYLAPEKRRVLSAIYRTISRVFPTVRIWPGGMTLFVASTERSLDLPYDLLCARINRLPVRPQFINSDYLNDRLDMYKVAELSMAMFDFSQVNSLVRPVLPHYQALFRSMVDSFDRKFLNLILNHPRWTAIVPATIVIILFVGVVYARKTNDYSAFLLYLTAGLLSLSLELISFYLYQTMAGSLYSEIAVLIGAFMLGLSLGAYYAHKAGRQPVEYPALLILITAILVFLATYAKIESTVFLYFNLLFLFAVALATGTLFVGATNRYYANRVECNRGAGYGWDLVGSALGALVTTTVLLPVIGIVWLLWSLVVLAVLVLAETLIRH